MTENKFTPKAIHLHRATQFAEQIGASRGRALQILEQALRSLHIRDRIPLDAEEINSIIKAACDRKKIPPESVQLAYDAIKEMLESPIETSVFDLGDDAGEYDDAILEALAPYLDRYDEKGNRMPIPYDTIFPSCFPGLVVFRDEGTSQARFDVWMEWKDRRWHYRNSSDIKNRIKRMIRLSGIEAVSSVTKLANDAYKNMRDEMRLGNTNEYGEFKYHDTDFIDSCEDLLLDASGKAISTIKCEPVPHRMDAPMRKRLAVEYDPNAKCPKWMEFLRFVSGYETATSEEERTHAQEWMGYQQFRAGYLLIKGNPLHRIFFDYGPPGCGKTTLLEVLMEILGDSFAKPINSENFIERKGGGRPPDVLTLIASLTDPLACIWSDLGDRGMLRGAQLKSLAGESKQQGRELYKDSRTFQNKSKHNLQSNTKIAPGDDVIGLERRMRMNTWRVPVPEERRNENIKKELLEERSGIFNWMLEGLRKYRESGENCPQYIIDDTYEYLDISSPVIRAFIKDQLVKAKDPEHKITLAAAYKRHRLWRVAVGKDDIDDPKPNKYMHTPEQFRVHLEKNYIKVEMEPGKTGRQYHIVGWELKDEQLIDPEHERQWNIMHEEYRRKTRNGGRKAADAHDQPNLDAKPAVAPAGDADSEDIPW